MVTFIPATTYKSHCKKGITTTVRKYTKISVEN
jgi:hypothetical protein